MFKKNDLDFEISFYENLIKEKPDFVEALIPLGNAYTKKGDYKKGLEIDKRLIELRPDDPIVFYNLACTYSLLNMRDSSFKSLEKAISLGYDDFEYMNQDQDLNNIKTDKRFNELISKHSKTPQINKE